MQSFQQSIAGRYTQGILGYGWTTNWDISATTMTNGDVVIENDGISLLLQPAAQRQLRDRSRRPGHYADLANGAYQLVDARRHDLPVQRQRHARLRPGHATATASPPATTPQGQLVSLTDSNGEYLTWPITPRATSPR